MCLTNASAAYSKWATGSPYLNDGHLNAITLRAAVPECQSECISWPGVLAASDASWLWISLTIAPTPHLLTGTCCPEGSPGSWAAWRSWWSYRWQRRWGRSSGPRGWHCDSLRALRPPQPWEPVMKDCHEWELRGTAEIIQRSKISQYSNWLRIFHICVTCYWLRGGQRSITRTCHPGRQWRGPHMVTHGNMSGTRGPGLRHQTSLILSQ